MIIVTPIIDHDLHSILRNYHVNFLEKRFGQIIKRSCANNLLVIQQNKVEACALQILRMHTYLMCPSQNDRATLNGYCRLNCLFT